MSAVHSTLSHRSRLTLWLTRAGIGQAVAWLSFGVAIWLFGIPVWIPSPVTMAAMAIGK